MTQEELNRQMIKAADNRDTKTVRKMLEQGADPNVQSRDGYTALMYACQDRRTDTATVRKMLEQGADPNVQNNYGETALMKACRSGHTDIARLLLEHGADPNVQNNDGETALIEACWWGYTRIMELLIQAGAETDIKNKYGDTAFDMLKEQYPDKYRQWVQVSAVKARKENLAREDSADSNSYVPDYEI